MQVHITQYHTKFIKESKRMPNRCFFLHEEKGDTATTPICWTLNKFNSRCNVESDCYIQLGNNNSIESEMFLATFDPIKRTHNDVSKKPET